jgi:hypothetical protein
LAFLFALSHPKALGLETMANLSSHFELRDFVTIDWFWKEMSLIYIALKRIFSKVFIIIALKMIPLEPTTQMVH